ncbi:MAG: class I SAM-dependent methyltransferase [Actinomycetota bacterium]|nr:class I SAM-dependent methyltransferase [Actinomycetota bacterium]
MPQRRTSGHPVFYAGQFLDQVSTSLSQLLHFEEAENDLVLLLRRLGKSPLGPMLRLGGGFREMERRYLSSDGGHASLPPAEQVAYLERAERDLVRLLGLLGRGPLGVALRRRESIQTLERRYVGWVPDLGTGPGSSVKRGVLGDRDVLSAQLRAAVERANPLVVLDLFSFPFESMTGEHRDVPLILVLPTGYDAEFLTTVFGAVAFERLGFFDRVATGDDALWEELRRRYRWAGGQRVKIASSSPKEAAVEIAALLEAEYATPNSFGDKEEYEATRYWSERGDALAGSAPHQAICSVSNDLRFDKATHRVQAAVLEPHFAAVRGDRVESVPFDVLEVGVGAGRWASSFDLATTRFVGVDISEGMVNAARANFPEGRFDRIGEDLRFPYDDESFDLVFSVTVMHHNPTPAKRTLLSEMWRVARPGGRLTFLEDFVAKKGSAVYPMSVQKFADLALEATAGQVVLEHVESLRYPDDDMVRAGLISLSKLGVPKTW